MASERSGTLLRVDACEQSVLCFVVNITQTQAVWSYPRHVCIFPGKQLTTSLPPRAALVLAKGLVERTE